jgi:hypothetical protein
MQQPVQRLQPLLLVELLPGLLQLLLELQQPLLELLELPVLPELQQLLVDSAFEFQ